MVKVTSLPTELQLKVGDEAPPSLFAGFDSRGIAVFLEQRGVAEIAARFTPDLSGTPTLTTFATGPAADWRIRRMVSLPTGGYALCGLAGVGRRLDPDGATVTEDAELAEARDLFVLGDRILIAYGSHYGNVYDPQNLRVLGGDGESWAGDLRAQLRAAGHVTYHWYHVRGAVLGDGLVITGQDVMRSGSSGHALIRLDSAGNLTALRPFDRNRVRADSLELVPDNAVGVVYAYTAGTLELIDETLATRARATDRHPFLAGFRLLAGDGCGRLLWRGTRRAVLVVSEPGDIDPGALDASLTALSAAATAVPAKRPKVAAPARSGIRKVARHTFHSRMPWTVEHEPRVRADLEAALDGRKPTTPKHLAATAEREFYYASAVDRDGPILRTAVEAMAWARTEALLTTERRIDWTHGAWIQAWHAALIARYDDGLDRLAAVDADDLWVNRATLHAKHWHQTLLALRHDPAAVAAHAAAAIAHGDPAYFESSYQHRMHQARMAVYPLAEPLARLDAGAFNDTLYEVLRTFKKHATKMADDGWVAVGALALCCTAADRGIPIEIESEYLLPSLIHR